jgi:uncharacterized protein
MTILLQGIVGSTAYGLNHAGSDIDRLGIFAAPTRALVGLHAPDETRVSTKPDVTMHEARKLCELALKCNPTVSEVLWLPDELIEVRTPLGQDLIAIRSAFLSAPYVRNAFLGYATQQFKRLETRGDGSFSADTRKRTAKHARHLARLARQGLELYTTGHLVVRLENPQWFHDFGEQVAGGDIDAAKKMIADHENAFNNTPSCLPAEPSKGTVEDWLQRVRAAHWTA